MNDELRKQRQDILCQYKFPIHFLLHFKESRRVQISVLKSPIRVCFCWDSTSYFIFEIFLVVNSFTIVYIFPVWALTIYRHLELIIKELACLCFLAHHPGSHRSVSPSIHHCSGFTKQHIFQGQDFSFFSLFLLFITGLYLSFFTSFNSHDNSVIDEEPKVQRD